MKLTLSVALLSAATLLASPATLAANRKVELTAPPPLSKSLNADLAAMPMIVNPVDAAERRINAALRRFDASGLKAAKSCKGMDGKPGDWSRSVETPMRGPGYLSFVIYDSAFCGGAHPDAATMSIVYDLSSGAPVDWTRLLPDSLTGKLALQEGMDGTKMVTLASKRLYALYLEGYKTGDHRDDKDCMEAVREAGQDGPPPMMAWLDAKAGGLAVALSLPHYATACADEFVIPLATLRAEGAQPVLLDAIAAAGGK